MWAAEKDMNLWLIIGVVNIKPEKKKLRPERDSNHDLCDTSAVLYQLRYQAIWELVTLYVCDM